MKPDQNINGPWELLGYSDVDYSVGNCTCKNLTGYTVLINGAVVAYTY